MTRSHDLAEGRFARLCGLGTCIKSPCHFFQAQKWSSKTVHVYFNSNMSQTYESKALLHAK